MSHVNFLVLQGVSQTLEMRNRPLENLKSAQSVWVLNTYEHYKEIVLEINKPKSVMLMPVSRVIGLVIYWGLLKVLSKIIINVFTQQFYIKVQ
ncbi:hypothetical protein [Aggregatibacter kilianii]|uniref:hypothetical protein n=1 Tax=Aggregatibacter kilianii TaxID=2025884 RepID=UPI000D694C2E|nr:hypothetical protein [Aggregatibacter kilianii]